MDGTVFFVGRILTSDGGDGLVAGLLMGRINIAGTRSPKVTVNEMREGSCIEVEHLVLSYFTVLRY